MRFAIDPASLPHAAKCDSNLDLNMVLTFALASSLVTSRLCGLVPAFWSSHCVRGAALREAPPGGAGRTPHRIPRLPADWISSLAALSSQ